MREKSDGVLEVNSLTIHHIARACHTSEVWVIQRVGSRILTMDAPDKLQVAKDHHATDSWQFSSETLLRARSNAELERTFDAVPGVCRPDYRSLARSPAASH